MKALKIRSLAISMALLYTLFSAIDLKATPIFDTFGPLPQATFGGTGIPNGEVAASTQIVDGSKTITIALSATQRFSNPALSNDGGGTYFATPGSNFGGAGQSTTEGALWNFNAYIDVDGGSIADYQFNLLYDFDPGFDTSLASLGSINITAATLGGPDPSASLSEGSQNLLFGFLATPVPFVVTPPPGSFDPNALGEYTFAIGVSTLGGFPLESVAIDVVVVPEPSTSLMVVMLTGLLLCQSKRS